MNAWNRVADLIRQEQEAQRQAEIDRQEAIAVARREAEERMQRTQRLLDESGVIRALEEVRVGMPQKPHMGLDVYQNGSAELKWGMSDRQHSRIRISVDPSTDAVVVEGKTIPANQWRENTGLIEDTIAQAYLNPNRVDLGPMPVYLPSHEPSEPKRGFLGDVVDTINNFFNGPPKSGGGGYGLSLEQRCCHCLSRGSLISTPIGGIRVENLKTGDYVWTIDENGKKRKRIIQKTVKVLAGKNHKMLKVRIKGGLSFIVSPEHPDKDGTPLIKVLRSLRLNGFPIVGVELTKYKDKFTYDILPEGKTGAYWVNGVLLGSTLASNFQHDFCPHYKSA